MANSNELKQIKKLYGEKFMHLCRRLFPTLLETEGLLLQVLKLTFSNNGRTLGEDITEVLEEDFKNFIYSKVDVEQESPRIMSKESPYELLDKAGYDLYECTTEEEIQYFRKYYEPVEQLCTFNGGRLDRCVVFWAVKKNVDEIIREDFDSPQREDEYGTSVMSIQFSREKKSTVSIKNRYNHTVNNPDATYGNDLDRIIPGLTHSFAELLAQRGMQLNSENIEIFDLPGYTRAKDGKYYKYNLEINGRYYCPGNIIIDNGNVISLEPEKKILLDYFILDRETGKIELYDSSINDCFTDVLKDSEKIEVVLERDEEGNKTENRVIKVYKHNGTVAEIKINKNNEIIMYTDDGLEKLGDRFLGHNQALSELSLKSVTEVGEGCILSNRVLSKLSMPSVTIVRDAFLLRNQSLTRLNLPSLLEAGNRFLDNNHYLTELNLPCLTKVGSRFLFHNQGLGINFRENYQSDNYQEQIMKILREKGIVQQQEDIEDGISTQDIAELDRISELTTTETEQGKAILQSIVVREKNNPEQEPKNRR